MLLPAERPGCARRVGIQHEGVRLGSLSAVSSGLYRHELVVAPGPLDQAGCSSPGAQAVSAQRLGRPDPS